ncbi:flagellar biosynthesis protein FlhB [uncultured Selenomonas sp.]|uniref:flagellar biosynthesis protein FlhB n=1 Tax=uncultured Selenomonas sp. TaxID=159275 RepID=UPI0025D2061D|nr:flagellar biosynthesis protein FlhB [uncultured Selenomonas sp.]
MEKSRSLCRHCNRDDDITKRRFRFSLQRFADDNKTEEPTAKKRADAAKKGQVGKSQEVSTAFVLLIAFIVIKVLWERIYANLAEYAVYIFGHLNQTVDVETVLQLFLGMIIILARTAFPIMLSVMIVGLAINIAQGGFIFSTEKINFDITKLNPINGFGRFFSKRALVELVKSLLKIAIIGFFIYNYLKGEILTMPQFIFYDLGTSLQKISDIIFGLVFQIIGVIMILAFADLAYQKWQTTQDLKMTKQEVKDEFKQTEGDPQIKGKIRQKQRQMAMSRMMQEVPKADVIVTNPTHFAVALKYEKGMMAPQVLAKGADFVAQKIKSVGREHDVPLVENRPLARALYASAEVGDYVPRELYQSVAEVLAYVYRLKHRRRQA